MLARKRVAAQNDEVNHRLTVIAMTKTSAIATSLKG
jgi:hypothetical protein